MQSNQFSISGGRVTTLSIDASTVRSVETLSGPEHGNATVNPDNSIALVMSGSDYQGTDSLRYRITHSDGSMETKGASWTVTAPAQEAGWGRGEHYMLEEDAQGDIIVETGAFHRKVYVSESPDALSLADIAARESLPVKAITEDWLLANEEYGATENMALDTEAAMEVWQRLTSPHLDQPVSHWLLFERGYSYDPDQLVTAKLEGESPLHPVHITAWGEGERPVITPEQYIREHYDSSNIVFSDLTFTGGILSQEAENILFDDMRFTGEGLNIRNGAGFTLHDSEVTHVVNDPEPGEEYWSSRKAGLLTTDVSGWLIEGTIFHHNGWEDDYRDDWSTEGGMPPNMFSHNVYLQNDTTDLTFRDNIIAEGSSFGAHIRGGGFVEGNLFLDNNNAVNLLGGIYGGDGPIGNFSFFADNVITSGAHKETDRFDGGLTRGLTNAAYDTTLLDNIVAHLADPNDPDDAVHKWRTHYALENKNDPAFDNTLIYNWIGNDPSKVEKSGEAGDRNIEDVDPALALQTTIQNFAARVMDTDTGTIGGLMDHIAALAETDKDDTVTASDIVAYFQNGFGFADTEDQTSHRFVPDARGDGIRWDNGINWTSGDLPDDGDDVDLAGNWVQYGGTTTLDDLDLGSGGRLSVNYGRLTVDGTLGAGEKGAAVSMAGAGQFWTDGYADADRIEFDISGGRFASTGAFTAPVTLAASGQAQAILATDGARMVLGTGSVLSVTGSAVKAGFDGNGAGNARLEMQDGATLRFVADADGISRIGEFRSGAWDQVGSSVHSEVRADGRLEIDLSGYGAGAGALPVISADKLEGTFDDITVTGLSVALDAVLNLNYDTDRLTLALTPGSGKVTYIAGSKQVFEDREEAPTPPTNPVDPPEGVTDPQAPTDPVTPPDEDTASPENPVDTPEDEDAVPPTDPVEPPADTAGEYLVKVVEDPEYSAGYDNVVGAYTVDGDGQTHDVQIVFGNAKTQKGESAVLDVAEGHDLHFFLVQNAASQVAKLAETDELTLELGDRGYELNVNGQDADWTVFYSEAADRNPDGLEHFRYGPADDSGLRILGAEDKLWGGDLDYNDVGLSIQLLSSI